MSDKTMIHAFLLSLLLAAPTLAESTPPASAPPGETRSAARSHGTRVIPYDLQCEYMTDPLGIDVQTPRLSWKLRDPDFVRGQKQTGCHVLVASRKSLLDQGRADLWDSGQTSSPQSVLLPYGGRKLVSDQDCYWKVRVLDKDGRPSAWSAVARFSMGLLQQQDWTGPWIKHPDAPAAKHLWFRRDLILDKAVRSAFIHVASLGYHELYVNGTKADARVLAPALTRLDKRVLYVTYDLASLLKAGKNTIALWTGPGWSRYSFFKTHPALRVQLNARCADGKLFSLASDKTWRTEISSSENMGETKYGDNGGEKVDARNYLADWNAVGFDDSRWPQAAETSASAALSAQMMEPTRVIETVKAIDILGSGPAYKVVLAKNFTGWLDIRTSGQAPGDVITINIANQDKTAQDFGQKSQYVCKGEAGEAFRNRFNFSAGRYVTLQGLKAKPRLGDVTGYAVATDLKRTGHFACSKELFNQIYEADLWTHRANTIEGYTSDCPHRERLGYGEESFANAWGIGLPNYQSGAFYMKHIRDWSDVQEDSGWINHTAPQINQHYGGPLWSSAGLNISWEFYRTFADKRALETTYPSSKRWSEFLASKVKGGLLRNYDKHWGKFLGDWAAPGQRRERGDSPQAEFFNNCVYAMNLATFVEIAKILDKAADAARYGQRLKELKTAVHARYFLPDKTLYSDGTQVQLAFPLLTGITPEKLRPAVIASFNREIAQGHPYLDMGSSGLPVLLKYLIEETDGSDYLFAHLSKTNEPSYGYFLRRGESTWPEYWNVDVPSRIHTCYTGIASWFIKGLGGIRPDPDCPGYQTFIIKPAIVGDLTFAEAATESSYGPISSRWERQGNVVKLAVTIPPNSQATVYVPTRDVKSVTESGIDIRHAAGVTLLAAEKRSAVLKVQSGRYTFSSKL